jgi:hypothetical protein
MSEIYTVAEAALRANERHLPVHIFPLRMTHENFERYRTSKWVSLRRNLKDSYDAFEDLIPLQRHGPGPIGVQNEAAAVIESLDRFDALTSPL